MYRELLISIGITCIVSVVLFLYFRNKIGKIEQKVDLMFQLIQEYEQQKNKVMFQPSPSQHARPAATLIPVSDDDDSDSEEISDNDEETIAIQIGESSLNNNIKSINLKGAEINSLKVEHDSDLDEISDLDEELEKPSEEELNEELDEELEKPSEEELDEELEENDISEEDIDLGNVIDLEKTDDVSVVKSIELVQEKTLKEQTVKQLRAKCEEKGFTNYKALRKNKLIELLESA